MSSSSRSTATSRRPLAGTGLALGACLVLAGFFLPWFDGPGLLSYRDFTGLETARTLRSLGLLGVGDTTDGAATLLAVALYLLPAAAANTLLLAFLNREGGGWRVLAGGLALYQLLVGVLLFALMVAWRGSEAPGLLKAGLMLCLGGAVLQLAAALWQGRPASANNPPA